MSWTITPRFTPADEYFQNVSLLLHGNADGSGNILDSSPTPKTISKFGNAASATPPSYPNSNSAFGNAIAFDGTGDYLTLPANSSLAMDSFDFTWEFWMYVNSKSNTNHIFAQQSQDLTFQFINTNTFGIYDGINRLLGNVQTGQWNHFALTRRSGNLQAYLDGQVFGSAWFNDSSTKFTLSSAFVGARWTGASGWNGYIDDLRITKGVARYTANFTPPAAPFPDI
jgi:hypothetical protein